MKRLFCFLAGLGLLSAPCFAQQQPQPQQPQQPTPRKIELVTLTGTIAGVENVAEYAPVTFTLRDAAGVNTVVSTVPKVILDKFGLKLEEKADVTVTYNKSGVPQGNTGTKTEKVYAFSLKVNGKEVTFYDPKTGTFTYSRYEAYYTLKEFKGEITKVDQRDVVQPGGDAAKPQKHVTLFLTVTCDDIKNPNISVKEPYITVPETYLQQIQFTPEVGMKGTLLGWIYKEQAAQMDTSQLPVRLRPTVKSITVNGKTYPFRDDDGKALWESKPGPATPAKAP